MSGVLVFTLYTLKYWGEKTGKIKEYWQKMENFGIPRKNRRRFLTSKKELMKEQMKVLTLEQKPKNWTWSKNWHRLVIRVFGSDFLKKGLSWHILRDSVVSSLGIRRLEHLVCAIAINSGPESGKYFMSGINQQTSDILCQWYSKQKSVFLTKS